MANATTHAAIPMRPATWGGGGRKPCCKRDVDPGALLGVLVGYALIVYLVYFISKLGALWSWILYGLIALVLVAISSVGT